MTDVRLSLNYTPPPVTVDSPNSRPERAYRICYCKSTFGANHDYITLSVPFVHMINTHTDLIV